MMSMKAEEKVIRQRLSVLELAQALGNVSEACRLARSRPALTHVVSSTSLTHGSATALANRLSTVHISAPSVFANAR
jgi:hypothetical protein